MSIDLAEYLAERKALVDTALDVRLPDATREPRQVHEAMRYAVLGPGKRIRPILATVVSDLAGFPPAYILDTACALEFIHAASLILDDMPCMDNAVRRRGHACTHVRYGEATASLAIVGLLTRAFDLVAANVERCAPHLSAATPVRMLAQMLGTEGIVGGQAHDLLLDGADIALPQLEQVHQWKSGMLFEASVRIPAYIAQLDDVRTETLTLYARNLGLAYQITDDVLDAGACSEDAGKTTYVTQSGAAGACARATALLDEAMEAVATFGPAGEPLWKLAAYVRTRTH